jgi:hypothetical protein
VTLGPGDFQRIGIQPQETRLDVIRRAASRATKSLARRQLDAPNPLTEQQLSRIAVSTYRLLDPRQRGDRQSRAHVGRIRPGVLVRAGRAEFADGRSLDPSMAPARTEGESSTGEDLPTHRLPAVVPTDGDDRSASSRRPYGLISATENLSQVRNAELDEWFRMVHPSRGVLTRLRAQTRRPGLILAMILALLLTAAALWTWGQNRRSVPNRLAPVVTQSPSHL